MSYEKRVEFPSYGPVSLFGEWGISAAWTFARTDPKNERIKYWSSGMSDRVISHALMSLFQVSISISLKLWRAYDKKTNCYSSWFSSFRQNGVAGLQIGRLAVCIWPVTHWPSGVLKIQEKSEEESSLPNRTLAVGFGGISASLVEPCFIFWRDLVEPNYPWWVQTSPICRRSVPKTYD